MKRIILASASPRRKDLMAQAGFVFEVCVSSKEETKGPWGPEEMVKRLSEQKALDVAEQYDEDCIVIGADTVVACDDVILGKPVDEADALRMLRMLQGRTHQVYTGVAIVEGPVGRRTVFSYAEKTDVTMYPLTDDMIRDYIKTKDPMDKAGAYGIQGRAGVFVKSVCGDYNNVVGLPVASIWQYFNSSKEDGHAAL